MKKYFVVETDEICEFGDVLNVTLSKGIKDGTVTVEKELEFNEDTMDWMIEMGFVEEREAEEDNEEDLVEFKSPCDELNALIEDFEELEQRVDAMDSMIREIYAIITAPAKEEKKNAQPKKKK